MLSLRLLPSILNFNSLKLFFPIMSENSEDINILYKRLNAANSQAESLHKEVLSIKRKIDELTHHSLFKKTKFYPENDGDKLDGLNDFPESSSNYEKPSKKEKFDFNKEHGSVVIYTDGACENNGKKGAKAGIGVWFGDNHPLNVSAPVKGKATNNVGEIQACIEALEIALKNDVASVIIRTDSQFTINCMTQWIQKWKRNNWTLSTGGDVKNKQELQKLDALRQKLRVKWEHVSAHKGIKGNEEADKLAREGATLYRS